jgi:3-amino-4-hydroxybenzoic acid synthase
MNAQSGAVDQASSEAEHFAQAAAREKRALPALAAESTAPQGLLAWFDCARGRGTPDSLLSRLSQTRYTGVVLYANDFELAAAFQNTRLTRVIDTGSRAELEELCARPLFQEWLAASSAAPVIASDQAEVLTLAARRGLRTCLRIRVDDAKSLEASIEIGQRHDFVMIKFRDPTNIPLELVIASLQSTRTILIKEIEDADNVDDAIVSLGVMEVGADGVMFSPRTHAALDAFLARLGAAEIANVAISTGTVVRSTPIGMGHRSCLDLTTLFAPTEGMLVGSTSQGGILCCPEVFFLPYMELRPFRINAGAVHSYVYNAHNRTDYMTELKAGSPVMVTDIHGQTRKAIIGRVKTEVRPLRLIEIAFPDDKLVNVIMQDDWHVRIFSAQGLPLNITELKPGDQVLGHVAAIGRHVGISVDEQIIER